MTDLEGQIMIMGEWGAEGFQASERNLTVKGLSDVLATRAPEFDLKVLISGILAIIGCIAYDGETNFSLEVLLPLAGENGTEVDISMVESNAKAARQLSERGYYLVWDSDGKLRAYTEVPSTKLEEELVFISENVAKRRCPSCR